MRSTITVIIIVLLIIFPLIKASSFSIANKKIVDSQGRQITFHGTNVVVKVPPYIPRIDKYDPVWSFSEEDMINCTKWGFNGIRLGMMWAGVEPKKDWYNETYLNIMEQLINKAGKYGIYTLIDFHQDLIAQKFCGDGIPTWLIDELKLYKTFPFPMGKTIKLNQSGLPNWSDCNQDSWGKYYFSYDVGQTFHELYKIGSHLNKKFTDYWIKVALKFRSNPYVIGYELINEPFVGNAERFFPLVIPSVAQRLNFQKFYDHLANQIHKVDPKTLIFFEPITYDNAVPVGFTHPPGGHQNQNKSVLAYHFYNPPSISINSIDHRVKDGERLKVATFLTQFNNYEYEKLERAQQLQQSWLYWIYKTFGKNWASPSPVPPTPSQSTSAQQQLQFIESGINQNITMTYLQVIAGNLIKQHHNFKTKQYTASYTATPGGKSVLYYCQYFNYPKGHKIEVTPQEKVTVKQEKKGYYSIVYNGGSTGAVEISLKPL